MQRSTIAVRTRPSRRPAVLSPGLRLGGAWVRWLALLGAIFCAPVEGGEVHFGRDVRPLLSKYCFECHGPDESRREADLRLDVREAVLDARSSGPAVVPGNPEQSLLLQRLSASDPEERMPPAASPRQPTAEEIELLRQWIAQGAVWEEHWSFVPPRQSPLPSVEAAAWPTAPLDYFILAELEAHGLAPNPPADERTWLRRVSLALTGLPPTPEEMQAFLADTTPAGHARAVDRLLDSPRFGERVAARWLDAARYADTNGYQSDGERDMWRWRDWVIEAFNRNLPFDQFTIEQLAGDLLPSPTLDQLIATGFNRNHRGNAEGGIIPEEYAVEYVVDRVDTTATVWLGLTLGCTRCHDHKYDPFTQRDFYSLYAFFNSVPEYGRAIKFGNSPPMIPAPTVAQQAQLAQLQAAEAAAQAAWNAAKAELDDEYVRWLAAGGVADATDYLPAESLYLEYLLDGDLANSAPPGSLAASGAAAAGGSGAAAAANSAPALEMPTPRFAAGRTAGQALELAGDCSVVLGDLANFSYLNKFSISVWVLPDDLSGGLLSRMTDDAAHAGYSLELNAGHVQFNLSKRWLDDALRVQTTTSLEAGRWQHVLATYDGSRFASGVHLYVDGVEQPLEVQLDGLNQSFETTEPLRLGSAGTGRLFRGRLDDVRIFQRAVPAEEAPLLACAAHLTEIVASPAAERTAAEQAKLQRWFVERHAAQPVRTLWQTRLQSIAARTQFAENLPTVMIMQELPQPRPAYILRRGQYDQPGEQVQRATPASLPPLAEEAPRNRLGLAQWLVSADNPLTARVAVNRFWQLLFGRGLVATTEDFGVQGARPTHRELLDWLAVDFREHGWDVKRLLKSIVLSSTYAQSARVSEPARAADPDNRLLGRFPRVRLPAETVRDQALFVSGLLVEQVGGPSVRPYQPAGLWEELGGTQTYVQGSGNDLYRRSLYTYWKRTVCPPSMMAFDAATRESCCVRETRTNTPLQALSLLNEVTYVEAARKLAERMLAVAARDGDAAGIAQGFALVLNRPPRAEEQSLLRAGLAADRADYLEHPAAALELLAIGEAPRDESLPAEELAAWTGLAATLLNLDETITLE